MAIAKDPKIIMTSDEFIRRLQIIAGRRTYYKNKYPDNLCYIHSDGRTSADCVNLDKAILNGYDVYMNKPGYYQRDLSNTGDCTEAELLSQCTDVSQDFKKIKAPAILYMKGHIGNYIGITPDNRFNVIECTTAWGGGVIYSWVDQDGTRRSENGGKPIVLSNGTYQRWTHYGYPTKWVAFNGQNVSHQAPKEEPKVNVSNKPILKKGSKGGSVDELKMLLIKHGEVPFDNFFDDSCLKAVKEFQKKHGLEVDGCVGPKTWAELLK